MGQDESALAEQFGRLGGTAYELRRVDARIEGRPMAPLSVLGQMRRELITRVLPNHGELKIQVWVLLPWNQVSLMKPFAH